jgi:DNA-binding response OmpR family regulator
MTQSSATKLPTERTGQGRLTEPDASPASRRAYGILVVDDRPDVGGMLEVGLRQEGFAVWLAANGREALDLYRRHRQTIDVVLLDVRMPGLDGPQTLAILRELNPRIGCCFMSGDIAIYDACQLRAWGAAAMFQKPFELAEVARALRELASMMLI